MMDKEQEIREWNITKNILKKKFPQLTTADLSWRDSTNEDLISEVANKLRMAKRELKELINND